MIRLTGVSVVCAVTVAASLAAARQAVRPSAPPPGTPCMSIADYDPSSTLVVAEHPVPRAKYPVIDVHSHQRPLSADGWRRLAREMDGLNLRLLVNLSGGSGARLREWVAGIQGSPAPGRMAVFANIDFSGGVAAGFGARAARQLEADIKAGAAGLKIFKDLGLRVRAVDGSRLPLDSPELDPIWETCARLNVPVLIHTGEPAPFFQPVDEKNERWLELMIFPSRRVPPPEYPTFEALMAERDRMFARHPKTRFIAAHMAYHANDLGRLGRLLDKLPNVYVETGAILAELGRQPHTARTFFVKYQDRVLFGKDAYAPHEFPYYWRVFETRDEYFDYYRNYHAFWKLYGLDLPDEVLRKVYYQNALKVVPALPRDGFPTG